VSNIDGKPDQKDQRGFISEVSPSNGSVVELDWLTGLNAPKGMAICDDNSSSHLHGSRSQAKPAESNEVAKTD
jgi:hypothetical protein